MRKSPRTRRCARHSWLQCFSLAVGISKVDAVDGDGFRAQDEMERRSIPLALCGQRRDRHSQTGKGKKSACALWVMDVVPQRDQGTQGSSESD